MGAKNRLSDTPVARPEPSVNRVLLVISRRNHRNRQRENVPRNHERKNRLRIQIESSPNWPPAEGIPRKTTIDAAKKMKAALCAV